MRLRAHRRRTAALALTSAAATVVLVAGTTPALAAGASAEKATSTTAHRAKGAVPDVRLVTLVTGDVVKVTTAADGHRSVALLPGPDGSVPDAAVNQVRDHLYVVPRTAVRLLAQHRVDVDLFDVTGLIADGYDDAHRATLPVILDYGKGAAAAARAATATAAGARKTRTLALLGDAVFVADKKRARSFWSSVTTGRDGTGTPTALADGAVRIDLDGRVHPVDVSQPLQQIHAPQAWAAGYDGSGVTVAVLDTGYDPTHPDLAGRVSGSANFTNDPSVVDIQGHGTHVASTIAGSGAASGGTYRGVAPGAHLLVG